MSFLEKGKDTATEFFNNAKEKATGFFKETGSKLGEFFKDPKKGIGQVFVNIKDKINDFFKGFSLREVIQDVMNSIRNFFSNFFSGIGDFFTGKGRDGSSGTSSGIRDGIVKNDGTVIPISEEDNVYATTKDLNVMDQASQMAMPNVPRVSREFTDAGIIQAIQVLTDVLRSKEITSIAVNSESVVNFDQYRVVGSLI